VHIVNKLPILPIFPPKNRFGFPFLSYNRSNGLHPIFPVSCIGPLSPLFLSIRRIPSSNREQGFCPGRLSPRQRLRKERCERNFCCRPIRSEAGLIFRPPSPIRRQDKRTGISLALWR